MELLECAAYLRAHDNYLLVTHQRPDGDTLGIASALCLALRRLGKTAHLYKTPEITEMFVPFVSPYYAPEGFVPETCVSVDVAENKLLALGFEGKISLKLDHHVTSGERTENADIWTHRAACGELDARRATDAQEIAGHGVRTMVDGHVVLAGNARMMDDSKITYTKNTGTGTVVYVARDGQFLGSVLIADEVKEHSKQAIAALKAQGVRTIMLTGDSEAVASEISGQLGLDEYHAQLLPADKVNRVEELLATKSKNDILTFAGDGINDAPVLMRADVGIAMGAMGSDAAIEAADVVLMDDDPAKISLAMKISRKCMHIVYQNIVFALAVKAIFLLLGALGIANMWWAVFADVGVMILAVLNAMRMLIVEKN